MHENCFLCAIASSRSKTSEDVPDVENVYASGASETLPVTCGTASFVALQVSGLYTPKNRLEGGTTYSPLSNILYTRPVIESVDEAGRVKALDKQKARTPKHPG